MAWTGTRHTELHATIVHLARVVWRASTVVVDATGVGAGLASFLAASLSGRGNGPPIQVLPFVFTQASKSALGWDFLGLIDSGRFKEYRDDSASGTPEGRLTASYWEQLRATTYETLPGPGKVLRWQMPRCCQSSMQFQKWLEFSRFPGARSGHSLGRQFIWSLFGHGRGPGYAWRRDKRSL